MAKMEQITLRLGWEDNPYRERKFVVSESSQICMDNFSADMLGVGDKGFENIRQDFEHFQDDLINDCLNGDPDASLTYDQKQRMEAFCRKMMQDFEGMTCETWGKYLAFAWGVLKAREVPLKEYDSPEELSKLTPDDLLHYECLFPKEKREAIHASLMAYYRDRDLFKDVDWVVSMCEKVKSKYNTDCKLAVELVKTALLKDISDKVG
jgi:hypothetical protein